MCCGKIWNGRSVRRLAQLSVVAWTRVTDMEMVGFWVYLKGFPDRLDGWVRNGEKSRFTLKFWVGWGGEGLCNWEDGKNRVGVSRFMGDNGNQEFCFGCFTYEMSICASNTDTVWSLGRRLGWQ